jgi:hypothetical protein
MLPCAYIEEVVALARNQRPLPSEELAQPLKDAGHAGEQRHLAVELVAHLAAVEAATRAPLLVVTTYKRS